MSELGAADASHEKCLTMRRLRGRYLSFGTGAERIAPESLTPRTVLLRSPQHIAQMASRGTRSSLRQARKRPFDDEILKAREGAESNQKQQRVNRDSGLSVVVPAKRKREPGPMRVISTVEQNG
jgi:hypothetical protein